MIFKQLSFFIDSFNIVLFDRVIILFEIVSFSRQFCHKQTPVCDRDICNGGVQNAPWKTSKDRGFESNIFAEICPGTVEKQEKFIGIPKVD